MVPPPVLRMSTLPDVSTPQPAARQSVTTSVVPPAPMIRTQQQPLQPLQPLQPAQLVNLQRPLPPQQPPVVTAASVRSVVVLTPAVAPRATHVERDEARVVVVENTVATTATLVLSTPPVGRPVLGVAASSEEVFVTRHATPDIEVYETTALTLKRRIPVPGLGSWPYGLAVRAGYLFVSDFVNNAVHRLEIVGLSTLSTRYKHGFLLLQGWVAFICLVFSLFVLSSINVY